MEIIFPRGDAPEKVAKNSVAVGTIKREQEVKEDGRKDQTDRLVLFMLMRSRQSQGRLETRWQLTGCLFSWQRGF